MVLDSGSSGTINTTVSIASGKIRTTGGTLELANNDYPKLAAGHTGMTKTITAGFSALMPSYAPSWDYNLYYMNATTGSLYMNFSIPNWLLVSGATLSSVDVYFVCPSSKLTIPSTLPNMTLQTLPVLTPGSVAPSALNLSSTTYQYYTPSPVLLSDWANDKVKKMTFTCNQNNVIDPARIYLMQVRDESGAGASGSNQFYNVAFNFSNITDMRPSI